MRASWRSALLLTSLCVLSGAPLVAQQADSAALAASRHYQAGDWAEAATMYEQLVRADSTNGSIWFRLGRSRLETGDSGGALAALERAESLIGAIPVVGYEIARAHAAQRDSESALARLRTAIEAGFAGVPRLEADSGWDALRDDPAFGELVVLADRNRRPCEYMEEHRQFDFWLGEWDVFSAQGTQLGTNSITRPEQECMLVEHWTSTSGGDGTSINYYDPVEEQWLQYWVAATWLLDLAGGITEDGTMVMEGTSRGVTGSGTQRVRGTWTPLDDGRVRQVFENWDEDSGTWQQTFEGFYVRRDSDEIPDSR